MSSVDENKAVARRVPEEIASEGKIELVDEISVLDPVEHGAFGELHGRGAIKETINQILSAFPDFSATVEEIVAEDDLVGMRVTLRGTHDGEPFMGIEPSGKAFEIQNMVITRIEDGKIAERWTIGDMASMMEQLGVLDSPGS